MVFQPSLQVCLGFRSLKQNSHIISINSRLHYSFKPQLCVELGKALPCCTGSLVQSTVQGNATQCFPFYLLCRSQMSIIRSGVSLSPNHIFSTLLKWYSLSGSQQKAPSAFATTILCFSQENILLLVCYLLQNQQSLSESK